MPRHPRSTLVDELELAATQELFSLLIDASGLSAQALEAQFAFGSDGTKTERSGNQLHRYLRAGSQVRRNARAVPPLKREQLLAKAQSMHLELNPTIRFASTLRALGPNSIDFGESSTKPDQGPRSHIERRADYTARKARQRAERKQLKAIQAGAIKQLSRLLRFLQSIDGRGHDGWHFTPKSSATDLPGSPCEQNDQLTQKLDDLINLISCLHLGISETWSADTIPEHRGMYPLLV